MGKREPASIVIPRLGDHSSANPDERDEHLRLLLEAYQVLEAERTRTREASCMAIIRDRLETKPVLPLWFRMTQ